MTDTEKAYNDLIGKLRVTKPVAGNPEQVTEEIMRAIGSIHRNNETRWLVWVRPLMTAASLFLFGLFLYQQFETNSSMPEITQAKYIKTSFLNKTNYCSASTSNLSENNKLVKQYICYMRTNMAENENSKQFYQKYLPKNRSFITQ